MSEIAPVLHEPWPDIARQRQGVSFGMWIFIASELLFFGGLFLAYAVYRSFNAEAFRIASAETDVFYGTLNTAILLTSSFTMAVAVHAAEARIARVTIWCLAATLAFGAAFLAVKGLEYSDDISKGLFPGPTFPLHPAATQLFWALYWIMTGIHAIHLTVGIAVVATLLTLFVRDSIPVHDSPLEGVALYWHLVDAIWIILLPLLYLNGRA